MLSLHEMLLGISAQSRYSMLSTSRCNIMWLASEVGWIILLSILGVCCAYCLEHIVFIGTAIVNATAMIQSSVILVVLGMTESDVHPFELIECEPEVVCGYFVDQGGVLFVAIYLADTCVMVV